MKVYCDLDRVIATHDDDQNIDPAVYGGNIDVMTVPSDYQFARIGAPPVAGEPDLRTCARPVLTSINELKSYLDGKRRQVEAGGTVVAGVRIPTDGNTRGVIDRIISKLANGKLTAPINFVLGGVTISADAAMFDAWDTAITTHVQAAFDVQTSLMADIDNATITTTTQIDAANWPS